MARKKAASPSNLSPIPIGNCAVFIEGAAKKFQCESNTKSLRISSSKGIKIKISVMEDVKGTNNGGLDELKFGENLSGKKEGASHVDCLFLLVNPKDADSVTKSLIQETLNLYTNELPTMNYAANTGKQSSFLERCVSNGKFCTLLLRLKSVEGSGKVIAAVTYQIIQADTQYAEIPLAAVCSTYQHKGIGRLLYVELRKRLLDVGISTVLCWGDKESEGFWHKQGFVSVAEVDTKGRARRLPIRADIRRALCFPGGSTLMVSHLNKNLHDTGGSSIKLWLKSSEKSTSLTDEFYSLDGSGKGCDLSTSATGFTAGHDNLHQELNGKAAADASFFTYQCNTKRRVCEASLSSLKSKRVKATHLADHQSYPDSALVLDKKQMGDCPSNPSHLGLQRTMSEVKSTSVDVVMARCTQQNVEECALAVTDTAFEHLVSEESKTRGNHFSVMLMDIANETKKAYLTKIIWDLGGAVTTDGSLCTHVLTVKARRTLNFCTALCSGAWIVSPNWLKESFRQGSFVDEEPFILHNEEYQMKFRVDLKEVVLRARANPQALLKGYSICLTTHVQPPIEMLTAVVRSAGGDVNVGLGNVRDKSRTIFIACEEDMEEALLAVRSGIRTFSSEWFMNCIMKQELELDAPHFAESL